VAPLKRPHWIAATLILILLVAVVFAPVPGDTRWIRTLHNSAHAPIFGCVSLLTLVIVRAHERWRSFGLIRQYATAVAAALVLGVVTELLQIPAGRDASFEDALHDVVGALAFLGIFAAIDSQVRLLARARAIRIVAAAIGIVALGVAAAPVTRAAIKYQQRDERFPVLADFSQRYDRYFIFQRAADFSPVTVPAPWSKHANEGAMRVRLLDGDYPGMEFIELRPDWSGYSTLAVDGLDQSNAAQPAVGVTGSRYRSQQPPGGSFQQTYPVAGRHAAGDSDSVAGDCRRSAIAITRSEADRRHDHLPCRRFCARRRDVFLSRLARMRAAYSTITDRIDSPDFIISKPSLICSSLSRCVTNESRSIFLSTYQSTISGSLVTRAPPM
jgi:hypothetical protein